MSPALRLPELYVEIVHEIPGRLRVRVSELPRDEERMMAAVSSHAGIRRVRFSRHTRTCLVTFDRHEVSSREIVVRVALALSVDRDRESVRVIAARVPEELSLGAFFSLLMIGGASLTRVVGPTPSRLLDLAAGAGTAGAVIEHAYSEARVRGDVDPEVLSLVYLLRSFNRGNLLPAAALTWLVTFGRHLLRPPVSGARLKRVAMSSAEGEAPHYEVIVSPIRESKGWARVLRLLPRLLRVAVAGDNPTRPFDLIGEIERVSLLHGEAIDGLGRSEPDIPLKIR